MSDTPQSKPTKPFGWMVPVVTLVVLIPAVFVIVTPYHDAVSLSWATGAIGSILGYWLRAQTHDRADRRKSRSVGDT